MEIGMWVTTELGLPEHESKFVDNHIDGSVLNMMTKTDLKKLGITSVCSRLPSTTTAQRSIPESTPYRTPASICK